MESRIKGVRIRNGMLVATVRIEVPMSKVVRRRTKKGPKGKLTPDQIRSIREEFSGWKVKELTAHGRIRRGRTMAFYSRQARKLGVTPANIGHIVNKLTWKEVK